MVDREKRQALFQRLREQHNREEAMLSASERLATVVALLDLAGDRPTTDEPPELWLALQTRLRGNG